MLASSSLLKQVTEHSLSLQLRLDIRNYVISYLATRGPELQTFVTGSLILLLCRITKFGWFNDDRFKDIVKEATNFFSQLTKAYFGFVEVLFSNHLPFILNFDTNTFTHIVGSLESGLKGLDANISSQCGAAVGNLAAFYFNNITVGESPPSPPVINLAQHIAECPNLFPDILRTLFEIVLFEDCGNQWSLSRPMLSLILISKQIFSDVKVQILASQSVDQQQRLLLCFDKLMADVTRSLDSKNRDKFTQNLTMVRHEFRVE